MRVFRRKMAVEEAWVQEMMDPAVPGFDASEMEMGVEQNGQPGTTGDGVGGEMKGDETLDLIF